MRLFLVELDRLRSRRAVALLVLAAALLTALLAATAIWDTRPVSGAERADAEVQAAAAEADPMFQRDLEQCREDPEEWFGPGTVAEECDRVLTPRAEDYLARNQLDLGLMVENRAVGVVLIVTALLIICGATFAGGDWASGSVGNQLLFRPRRLPVWGAKAGAVLVGSVAASGVIVGGFWLTMWLTAEARGIVTPDPVVNDIWWMSVRGVVLATAGAVGGFALTMLLRSTVATMAVLFAYVVGGEALILALPLEKATQWSLSNNVFAWINDGNRVYDPDIVCPPGRGGCDQSYVITLQHAAVYLGVLLGLAVLASIVSFRRRDIP
ncbi:MAG: hypothetical protein ACXWXO_14725 [Nocardioides sp.]